MNALGEAEAFIIYHILTTYHIKGGDFLWLSWIRFIAETSMTCLGNAYIMR